MADRGGAQDTAFGDLVGRLTGDHLRVWPNHDRFEQCYNTLTMDEYTLYTLEPDNGCSLRTCEFPKKSAFVFGHEQFGLSFEPRRYEGVQPLRIEQFGKVQSLNVSIAASIVLYEYLRQHSPAG